MALLNHKEEDGYDSDEVWPSNPHAKQLFTTYLASMVIRAVYGCRPLVLRRYIRHSVWSRLGMRMMNQRMKMMSRQQV